MEQLIFDCPAIWRTTIAGLNIGNWMSPSPEVARHEILETHHRLSQNPNHLLTGYYTFQGSMPSESEAKPLHRAEGSGSSKARKNGNEAAGDSSGNPWEIICRRRTHNGGKDPPAGQ